VRKCQANTNNMSDSLRDIYKALESRYVHEGRTIDPSFYNDLSDDSMARFTAIGLDELEKTLEQIEPYNSRLPALGDIQNLIHRRTIHEKIDKEGNTIHKLPNQIETNELFDHLRPYNPSTLPTSSLEGCTSLWIDETKALKDDPNMSKEQRETRWMFKNLGRALHNIARMLKTRGVFKNLGRALHNVARMLKTRGVFKNLGRALHNVARMLKKGCR
ncbi:hypothetical protein Tco_1170631, partial [Tanacetum coccineum]